MNIIKLIKNYRKLGKEEFWKRFREGVNQITPTQKTKGEINGIIIMLIGITLGLIATPIIRISGIWFWIEIILIGSLIMSIFQLIGKLQLYKNYKAQDKIMEELNKKDYLPSDIIIHPNLKC